MQFLLLTDSKMNTAINVFVSYSLFDIYVKQKVKVKVSHSINAVGAVGIRVPLYLGHS